MNSWTEPDLGKSNEQLLTERTKCIDDALQMKQPDRIPIILSISYLAAEMTGITCLEMHKNFEKGQEALE